MTADTERAPGDRVCVVLWDKDLKAVVLRDAKDGLAVMNSAIFYSLSASAPSRQSSLAVQFFAPDAILAALALAPGSTRPVSFTRFRGESARVVEQAVGAMVFISARTRPGGAILQFESTGEVFYFRND